MDHDRTRPRFGRGAAVRTAAFILVLILCSSAALASQSHMPASGTATAVSRRDASTPAGDTPSPEPGPPLYPDLVALPPEDLYLSTEMLDDGARHHLLRFTTSVANTGEGPLELAGSTQPGGVEEVRQVVYDAIVDGTVVEDVRLGTDLIYHPEHHHFHLDGFAAFELLREEPDGELVPTGEDGKQSSCLLDTLPVTADRTPVRQYQTCELERQGISVGWKDVYAASLPGQWVDLGSELLADGSYVLRYIVDPLRQLHENGRVDNNVAETAFTVRAGEIVGRPDPPRCAIEADASEPADDTITMRCSHFPDNALITVYWDGWDPWDGDAQPIASIDSRGPTASVVTFPVPDVPPGSYTIAAVAFDDDTRRHVSATVIHGVLPAGTATPAPASPVTTVWLPHGT